MSAIKTVKQNHPATFQFCISFLVKCADGATQVEVCLHGATQAGGDEGEGTARSPDSWPEVRSRCPEGAATHLRDFQPEERRGVCSNLISVAHHNMGSKHGLKLKREKKNRLKQQRAIMMTYMLHHINFFCSRVVKGLFQFTSN